MHPMDRSVAVEVSHVAAGGGNARVVSTAFAVETHFLVMFLAVLVDDFDLVSAPYLPSLKACYCVKMTLHYCSWELMSL